VVSLLLPLHNEFCNNLKATAFASSSLGAVSAENAFYDQSILGLLYFPVDEMYAVFLPALLPMTVALLSTAVQHYVSWLCCTCLPLCSIT
jgi:hypothetical protein